jgi:hypothetical protein
VPNLIPLISGLTLSLSFNDGGLFAFIGIIFLNLFMEIVIMHPKSKEQLSALKAFAKALKVDFETSTYNADFVAKIKASTKQVEAGNYITLDPDKSLWENLG